MKIRDSDKSQQNQAKSAGFFNKFNLIIIQK